jgi:hypothetical protein
MVTMLGSYNVMKTWVHVRQCSTFGVTFSLKPKLCICVLNISINNEMAKEFICRF